MNERQNQKGTGNKSRPEIGTGWLGGAMRFAGVLMAIGGISLMAGFETARRTLPATARVRSRSRLLGLAGLSMDALYRSDGVCQRRLTLPASPW